MAIETLNRKLVQTEPLVKTEVDPVKKFVDLLNRTSGFTKPDKKEGSK